MEVEVVLGSENPSRFSISLEQVISGFGTFISKILKALPQDTVKRIVVVVDTLVVLSWILSKNIKTKRIFTRNRLKDICERIGNLIALGYDLTFKYIRTTDNPADLITRGITLERFRASLKFWLTGPEWLTGKEICWPSSGLNCLS